MADPNRNGFSSSQSMPEIYVNESASTWTSIRPSCNPSSMAKFHSALPGFEPTPLISLEKLAEEMGIGSIYLKDEGNRCGLPSFKILGASWAAYRAIARKFGFSLDVGIDRLLSAVQGHSLTLFAATDGNHGRAVARIAKLLGVASRIFVPQYLDQVTADYIRQEGAEVMFVDGSYDDAVNMAYGASNIGSGILIQDTAFEGYEEIPQWTVDGYSTVMIEIDDQLASTSPTHIIVPAGVGSLTQAVVSYSKRPGANPICVLAVEADAAPCIWESLQRGIPSSVITSETIMTGLNCGTVSTLAWPILKSGLDSCLKISDSEAHNAVGDLLACGINAGPCGAAALAALKRALTFHSEVLGLGKDSVVVLLCTEKRRVYNIPLDGSGGGLFQVS